MDNAVSMKSTSGAVLLAFCHPSLLLIQLWMQCEASDTAEKAQKTAVLETCIKQPKYRGRENIPLALQANNCKVRESANRAGHKWRDNWAFRALAQAPYDARRTWLAEGEGLLSNLLWGRLYASHRADLLGGWEVPYNTFFRTYVVAVIQDGVDQGARGEWGWMLIMAGTFAFEWIEGFADIPDPEAAAVGWAHHDIALAPNGNLLMSHPSRPALLELAKDGSVIRACDLPLTELHGITVCLDGSLWLADIGRKRRPEADYNYVESGEGGRVIRLALSGQVDMDIRAPDLPVYRSQAFSPTKVAVWSELSGGNGDIWVADGYGQSMVHRFSSAGEYVASISGDEGPAGSFKTPHSIWLDHRGGDAELYIADRANNRIQVYDLDGAFKRCFGQDFLVTPSAFAAFGDHLVVAELSGRLTILDRNDRPAATIGSNLGVASESGWPNMLDGNGLPMRSDRIRPGAFNSPHGLATDRDGNIYISEWLIGGRYIKLSRA